VPFLTVTLETLAAIAGLFPIVRWFEKATRLRRIALCYGVVVVLSLFFMTKFSSFIWQMAPFMKFLQYPFRLNILLVLSVAALAAVAGPHLLQPRSRMIMLFLCVVVAGWLRRDVRSSMEFFSVSVWRTALARRPRVTPEWTEAIRQAVRTQIDASAMWPKPANLTALRDYAAFDRFVATHPPKTARLEALSTGQSSGTARVESWQPRRVMLKIEALRDSQLTLNHFYYVGWQGRIDGTETILTVSPSPDGLIQFDVPKGDYDLIVELPKDRAERAGKVISLVSLALLGGAAIWAGLGANRAGRAAAAS